jgi:hypothetical protein
VVLVTPAGRQQNAIRELFQESRNGSGAGGRVIQKIQAEFQKDLARRGLAPGMFEESGYVWQTQCDANSREQLGLRHW